MDPKLTIALNDFNAFLELMGKQDKSEAYQLLRQINLSLVERYYQDNPPPDRTPKLFDTIARLRESLKTEDEYRKLLNECKVC